MNAVFLLVMNIEQKERIKELNDMYGYSDAFYTLELPIKYWY